MCPHEILDDTRMGSTANRELNWIIMQEGLNNLVEQSFRNAMKFNHMKCIHLWTSNMDFSYKRGMHKLQRSKEDRDSDVLVKWRMVIICQCKAANPRYIKVH